MVKPITNNKNKGYLVEPKQNIKVIDDESLFFLQKSLLRFKLEPSLEKNLKKFIEVFELDPTNENFISKAEEKIKQFNDFLQIQKYDKLRFGILFCLRELDYFSFEQFKRILNCNERILSEVIKELKEKGLIKESPLHNPKVKELNQILKYGGESKKRKFYQLNKKNQDIQEHIKEIDPLINTETIEDIQNEKDYLEKSEKGYEKENLIKKEKEELRKSKQVKKFDKIIIALYDLYMSGCRKNTSEAIAKYLHFTKGLVRPIQWKGKKDKYANYSSFCWRNYLIEQGFIQEVTENEQNFILITSKVEKYLKKLDTSEHKENIKQIENKTEQLDEEDLKYLELTKTAEIVED